MFHKNLTHEAWQSLSCFEQLANIGSEAERTITWRRKNKEYMMLALYRMLELLDFTVADPKNTASLRELLRVREFFCDFIIGKNQYGFTDASWQKYFMAFTVAAQNRRLSEKSS